VGIKEVIYLEDKHHDDPIFVAARRLFDAAGVNFRQYQPAGKNIEIAI
jgi:dCMP deaminase